MQQTKDFQPHDRIGAIVCDEIHIQNGIVWSPNGDIVGLEDPDSVTADIDILDQFVRSFEEEELNSLTDMESELPENIINALEGTTGPKVAKRALQLAFSSFLHHYTTFFAFFLTNDIGFNNLYDILNEGTARLAAIGFRVISWCGDLATVNESCWKSISNESKNPYTGDPLWPLFCFAHLFKTTRNAVESSQCTTDSTRTLRRRTLPILWSHFFRVYLTDQKRQIRATKLTADHLHLSSYS